MPFGKYNLNTIQVHTLYTNWITCDYFSVCSINRMMRRNMKVKKTLELLNSGIKDNYKFE